MVDAAFELCCLVRNQTPGPCLGSGFPRSLREMHVSWIQITDEARHDLDNRQQERAFLREKQ